MRETIYYPFSFGDHGVIFYLSSLVEVDSKGFLVPQKRNCVLILCN